MDCSRRYLWMMVCGLLDVCKWPRSITHKHRKKKERARTHLHPWINTHTHTQKYIPLWIQCDSLLGVIELSCGMTWECLLCAFVCICVCQGYKCEGLSSRGRLFLMNPPGPRFFHWQLLISPDTARAAAEHGLATDRHASVSIRRRCPLYGAPPHPNTHTRKHKDTTW